MDINNTRPVTHAAERFLKGVGNRKPTATSHTYGKMENQEVVDERRRAKCSKRLETIT